MGVALAFALATTALTPASAQTLQDELERLVQEHPQLKASRDAVEQARAGITAAAAGGLPNVTLTGDATYKKIDSPSTRAIDNPWSRIGERAGVNVSQNLFDGGRTAAGKQGAQLQVTSAEYDLRGTRQQLLLQGVTAYIEVVRQARLVDLSRKNERIISDRLSLEDERVQRGGGTAVDVLLAKTRLQLAKERRVVLEGQLRDMITRYNQVFGHPPDPERMVDPPLAAYLVPADLDSVIAESFQRNPVLTGAAAQVEAARIAQRSARAEYLPTFDLTGAMNWEKDREGTMGIRRDASVGIEATWNIFNGFATRAAVADAAFNYSSQLNNRLNVGRKVEEEARLAWQGVSTACDRRLLLDNAVSIAAEVHDARVRLRDAGRETIVNVLDAESELFNSEINLVTSIYDEKLAVYRLAVAMGRDILVEMQDTLSDDGTATNYESRCAAPNLEPAQRQAGAATTAPATPAPTPATPAAPAEVINPFRAPEPAANPFAVPPGAAVPANPFLTPAR